MSQIPSPAESSAANPPDIKSAVQGFAAAVVLVGLSSMSGSTLPLFAAAMITVYVLVVPLPLAPLLGSRLHGLKTGMARIATFVLLVAVLGTVSVNATNSNFTPLMVAGTLANLALIAGVSVVILRIGLQLAGRFVPVCQREVGRVVSSGLMSVRVTLLLLVADLVGERADATSSRRSQ